MNYTEAIELCRTGKYVSCQKLITKYHCSYIWCYEETGNIYGSYLYKGVNDKYMSKSDLDELKDENWVKITYDNTDTVDCIMKAIEFYLKGTILISSTEEDKIASLAVIEALKFDNQVTRHIFPRRNHEY